MAQHYARREQAGETGVPRQHRRGGNESAAAARGIFCGGQEKRWGDCGACERMDGMESRMIPIVPLEIGRLDSIWYHQVLVP